MISEVLDSFWTQAWMSFLNGALYLQKEHYDTFNTTRTKTREKKKERNGIYAKIFCIWSCLNGWMWSKGPNHKDRLFPQFMKLKEKIF